MFRLFIVPVFAAILALAIASAPDSASAEEGMWLFNDFPSDAVEAAYGFKPDDKWLKKARLASVRLAGGCSGSFVSKDGLILTNHHCASGCIQQLSTAENDLMENGFLAETNAAEMKCPEIEINQLVEITDVTDRVNKATEGKTGPGFGEAQKSEMSRIEKSCTQGGKWRCDVVTLYHGGAYHLYRYKRYQDVRLVFAPEFRAAFFGGDPDNFTFPRYDLDMSLLRVYENGKPAKTPDFFRFSTDGAADGDLTFVSGHPGSTQRMLTVSQLAFLRDVMFPARLMRLSEARGMLAQFGRQSPEARRTSQDSLFGVENAFKAINGEWKALLDPVQFKKKADAEFNLRINAADPELEAAYAAIDQAQKDYADIFDVYMLFERGQAFSSDLFAYARMLVRGSRELEKADDQRLREYTDANLPALTQRLLSTAPYYPEIDQAWLTFGLTKMREILGTDHPLVKKVLGSESPDSLAAMLIAGSTLGDPAVRKALWEGGRSAIESSMDPMILMAMVIDDDARAVRKQYEDEVEAITRSNSAVIARAWFKAAQNRTYPDATFTLRLSYGSVKGYQERGSTITPLTNFKGAFERHTGKDPYALPKSWLDARPRINLEKPLNMVTSNDIIGGNSGSPVFNKELGIVGLIFDGNIQSLGGAFWFDESVNRAVSVSSAAIIEALRNIYGAGRLVKELTR